MQENLGYYEEFADFLSKNNKNSDFINILKDKRNNITTTKVKIKNTKLSKAFNKEKGIYYSVKCNNFNYYDNTSYKAIINKIIKSLKEIVLDFDLKDDFTTLVVGLGNSNVLCDSLGVRVCDKLIVPGTLQIKKLFSMVYCFCPSVFAKTGIATCDLVLAVAEKVKPDFIILIDTLTCKDKSLLGKCFQLNNVGLKPGGLLGQTKWINKKTMGVPVVSIGVPLVTNFSDIMGQNASKNYYTDKNIDAIVMGWSYILSVSINKFLHSKLSIDDILFYMS